MALFPLLLVLALPTAQGVDEESRYDVYRQADGYRGHKMHGGTTVIKEGSVNQALTNKDFNPELRSSPISLIQEAFSKHSFRDSPVNIPDSFVRLKSRPLTLRQTICKLYLSPSRKVRAAEEQEQSQDNTDLPQYLKDQQFQLAEEVLLQELNHINDTKTTSVPSHATPVVKKPTPNLTDVTDELLQADELIPVSPRPRVTTERVLESSGFGETPPRSKDAVRPEQATTLSTPEIEEPTEAVIPVSSVSGRTGTNSGIQSEESENFLPKPSPPSTIGFPAPAPTYVPYWLNSTDATQQTVSEPERTATEGLTSSPSSETSLHPLNSLSMFRPTDTPAENENFISSDLTSTVAPATFIEGRTGVNSKNQSETGGQLFPQERPEDQSSSDSDILPVLTKPSHTFYSALPGNSWLPSKNTVLHKGVLANKPLSVHSVTSNINKTNKIKGSSIRPQYAIHTPGSNYQLSLICDSFYPFKCHVKRNITHQPENSVSNYNQGQAQVYDNPKGETKVQEGYVGNIQEPNYIQRRPFYSAITYPGVFYYPVSAGNTGVNSGPIFFPNYSQESPRGQRKPCLVYRPVTCTQRQILCLKTIMKYATNVFDVSLHGRRKREVWGDLVELPEGMDDGPIVSEHLLEAVETLDEESLLEVLAALREEYVAERPGAEPVVEEVYHRLVTSLLAYKRGRERRSVKAAAAAVTLELLAEGADPPLGDSPAAPEPQRHHEEPDDLSFLELLNLASRHKTKSKS